MLEALIEQHEGAMEACTTIEQEGQILLDYLTLVINDSHLKTFLFIVKFNQ